MGLDEEDELVGDELLDETLEPDGLLLEEEEDGLDDELRLREDLDLDELLRFAAIVFFLRAVRAFGALVRFFFFFISPPIPRPRPIMASPSRRARTLGKTILNSIHDGTSPRILAPAAAAAIMPP